MWQPASSDAGMKSSKPMSHVALAVDLTWRWRRIFELVGPEWAHDPADRERDQPRGQTKNAPDLQCRSGANLSG